VKTAAGLAGFKAHPRFSPGFGDLPLTVQAEILGLLDAGRRMGITLSDSFLMAPSKSVTAIIGLEPA
jgi:cobalamin-dependent methionine synthase I